MRDASRIVAVRLLAVAVLVGSTGVGAFGAIEISRNDFVVVLWGTVILTPVVVGLVAWAVCLALSAGAMTVFVRRRPHSARSRLLGAGAGLWALITVVSGWFLLGDAVLGGIGGFLYNRVTEVWRSPTSTCAVVLVETATFDQATEKLYILGPLHIGAPYQSVTINGGRLLHSGRIGAEWQVGGGSILYSEGSAPATLLDFRC